MAAFAAQNTSFDSNAIEQISTYLGIETLDEKQEIVNDLLVNGRSSIRKYEQFIPPELFSDETDGDSDTPLLQLLKQNLIKYLESSLQNHPSLLSFINNAKSDNPDHFSSVLRATAESGGTSTPVVFVVLQVLFHTLDPITHKKVLTEIFDLLKNEGFQSIRKFSDYIPEEDLEEQLKTPQSSLFQALLMYNKEQVSTLLRKHKIPNTKELYNIAANSVSASGLLNGIEAIRSKISPILYKSLIESLGSNSNVSLQQQPTATSETIKTETCRVETPQTNQSPIVEEPMLQEAQKTTAVEHTTVLKADVPFTSMTAITEEKSPVSLSSDDMEFESESIEENDRTIKHFLIQLKEAASGDDRQAVCHDFSVSIENFLKAPYLTLEEYIAAGSISSKVKIIEDAAVGNTSIYLVVKKLQLLVVEALYLRKVALAGVVDQRSKKNLSVFLFGIPPLTVSEINRRFRLWSRLYHEDKIKFSRPEDLPLFKKIFLEIIKSKTNALSKIEATVGNSSYADHFTSIGQEFSTKAVLVKNARKPGSKRTDDLLNYTDLELQELQHYFAYTAYKNYLEACKALRGIDVPKQKIELRKKMALSLFLTGCTDYLFEAQIFTIAAIYILAQEKEELQEEMFPKLQEVLQKVQRREPEQISQPKKTSKTPNTSVLSSVTSTADEKQIQPYEPELCRPLSIRNENVRKTEILNNVHSDLRTVLLKSCMMKGTHCKVNTSEREIVKAKVHSALNIIKGISSGLSGVAMAGMAIVEGVKDVTVVVATGAVVGPSVLLIGGCVFGFFATSWLAYVFIRTGLDRAREPKIREKLNDIVARALQFLQKDRIEEFLETLASNYAYNEKNETKKLFAIDEIEKEIVLTLEPKKIISELLSHDFRPDGIAYLLILIGESLLKGPKLLREKQLAGYEIAQSSFNNIAMDIFKKVYTSTELSKIANTLDNQVIRSQLGEKANFFETLWSGFQKEMGHRLYAIPREYLNDSEQPTPFMSRLKELCCIARINFAIANIIEARPQNLGIGRQTVIDLKKDLETSSESQFFEVSEVRIQAMENLLSAFDYDISTDFDAGTVIPNATESQYVFIEKAVILENIEFVAMNDGSKLRCEKPVLITENSKAAELLENVLVTVPDLNLRNVLKEISDEPLVFNYENLARISELCRLKFQTCNIKADVKVGHIFTVFGAIVGANTYTSLPTVYVVLETQGLVKITISAFVLSNPTLNGIMNRLFEEKDEAICADLCNEIARHYSIEAEQLDLKHHLLALPKWHNALAYYSFAHEYSSANKTAILGKIRCLIASNKYEKAKILLIKNRRYFLESGEFHFLLALMNRKMRKYSDASFALQTASELGAGSKAEKKVLEKFNEKKLVKDYVTFYRSNSVTKSSDRKDLKTYNILSIDGGGVRGLLPAVWLSELERRAGRSCASLFHMTAGTSTGAIIAAGLSTPDPKNCLVPRYRASEILELYTTKASQVFTSSSSLIDKVYQMFSQSPKYNDTGRIQLFDEYFGNTLFSQSLTDLVIPAVKSSSNGSVIFASRDVQKDPLTKNLTMKEILMCTTAAPTFFPPYLLRNVTYVDGSVQANNPAMIAYVKALNGYKVPKDDIFVFSLGTGDYVPNELDPNANRDLLFWIANRNEIPKVIFDGPMNNLDLHMFGLLNDGCYNRWQVWLENRIELDNCGWKNLELLSDLAKEHYEVLDAYDDHRRLGRVIERLRGEIA